MVARHRRGAPGHWATTLVIPEAPVEKGLWTRAVLAGPGDALG